MRRHCCMRCRNRRRNPRRRWYWLFHGALPNRPGQGCTPRNRSYSFTVVHTGNDICLVLDHKRGGFGTLWNLRTIASGTICLHREHISMHPSAHRHYSRWPRNRFPFTANGARHPCGIGPGGIGANKLCFLFPIPLRTACRPRSRSGGIPARSDLTPSCRRSARSP